MSFDSLIRELDEMFEADHLNQVVAKCTEILADPHVSDRLSKEAILVVQRQMGRAYYYLGDLTASIRIVSEIVNQSTPGQSHASELLIRDLSNLGHMYSMVGNTVEAEAVLQRAASMVDSLSEVEQAKHTAVWINMAELYQIQKRFKHAEKLLLRAARVRLRWFGRGHPLYAAVYSDLGWLFNSMGHRTASERALRKSVRIFQRANDRTSNAYAKAVDRLRIIERLKANSSL